MAATIRDQIKDQIALIVTVAAASWGLYWKVDSVAEENNARATMVIDKAEKMISNALDKQDRALARYATSEQVDSLKRENEMRFGMLDEKLSDMKASVFELRQGQARTGAGDHK